MKVEKTQILCIGLGITLCLASVFVEKRTSALREGNTLFRNSHGQGDREEELIVEGLFSDEQPLTVSLKEQQYDKEQAEAAFEHSYEEVAAQLLGDNPALNEIRTRLNLIRRVEGRGISIEWSPEDQTLIDLSGEVASGSCPEDGTDTSIRATLKTGPYSREYVFPLRIYPPHKTEDEVRLLAFYEELEMQDNAQNTTEKLCLPEQFEGRSLYYRINSNHSGWVFLMLGIAAAVLLPLKKRQDEKEYTKKRERQMLLDYSEVVSKLVVFMGAGLPIRKAWERIVADYEDKRANGKESRYAYEEMKQAYYLMERGVPETKAYAEFGNRCHILAYRKLAGILEQNVRNGSAGLRSVLETEMHEAFEQRKTMARRFGEEAGTKLLAPLFMMLAVVMVIISVPAFLSFGI